MDLELNTLHLMARCIPPCSSSNKPQYRDHSIYKKRIRKTTRDLLEGKGSLPHHVTSHFREYVESLIRVYEVEDAHQAYQGEYAGLPSPEKCNEEHQEEVNENTVECTTRLLSTSLTPEAAVKQGLGVVTHKKKVALPEKRRRRKNKDTN